MNNVAANPGRHTRTSTSGAEWYPGRVGGARWPCRRLSAEPLHSLHHQLARARLRDFSQPLQRRLRRLLRLLVRRGHGGHGGSAQGVPALVGEHPPARPVVFRERGQQECGSPCHASVGALCQTQCAADAAACAADRGSAVVGSGDGRQGVECSGDGGRALAAHQSNYLRQDCGLEKNGEERVAVRQVRDGGGGVSSNCLVARGDKRNDTLQAGTAVKKCDLTMTLSS